MKVEIIISFYIVFFQQLFIVKVQANDVCSYYDVNNTISTVTCDECCSVVAVSARTACCSSISLSTLAIPFFIIAAVCVLGICLIYCRPFLKACFCGFKCPCGNRSRVSSPRSLPPNDNPIFVLNNDDLPDYETITKDSSMKDPTPPPYNFVATHPNEFNIEARVPSAPPQYHSRRSSLVTTTPDGPVN